MTQPGKSTSSASTTRALVFLIVAALLFSAYWFASPYITLYRVGQAVDGGDADYICERINFEKLQDNLEGNIGDAESPMVRGMLRSGISCETIEGAMELAQMFSTGEDDSELADELMEHTTLGFDSPVTFSVRVGEEEDGQLRLVMSRTLVSWELTDIVFAARR